MAFEKVTFVDNSSPYITADFLNGLQDFVIGTDKRVSEYPAINSSASNYEFASADRAELTDSDFPLRILFVAPRNSADNDTFTYKYNLVDGIYQSSITGYIYEPWHYRYVGKELSLYLTQNNLTLEEYHSKNEI